MAFQLLGACLAGVFLGRWLDATFQMQRPTFAVFLTVFFMVASLINLTRRLMREK
jgi:F0F1-type ATP synthase assembly protein I